MGNTGTRPSISNRHLCSSPAVAAGPPRRRSVTLMEEHMTNSKTLAEFAFSKSGSPVTLCTARPELPVARGPNWRWGDEDGGAGKTGLLLHTDEDTNTGVVRWYGTGLTKEHYRIPASEGLGPCDLREVLSDTSRVQAVPDPPMEERCCRRNSQESFSQKHQTVLVFDWDDTLFPSTYIRGDLRLSLRMPLRLQNISEDKRSKVRDNLSMCTQRVEQLLKLACSMGKVVLLTLARQPWVTDSCAYFYPGIGELIKALDIKIVYAQQGNHVDYNKLAMMSDDDTEAYWSKMKGEAIGKEVQAFYSQYEGQSWKNVISIGDSDFERLGTIHATEEYMRRQGIAISRPGSPSRKAAGDRSELVSHSSAALGTGVVRGQHYRVRTKCFKLVDQPTVNELLVQLDMLIQWLPLMVRLDNSFDVEFGSINDLGKIKAIETTLRGEM